MAALIALVTVDTNRLRRLEKLLSDAGYVVAAVSSFAAARTLLASVTPDLLIADVQLGAYNGLHLAIYSSMRQPRVPALIVHGRHDAVLENEARQLDAAFIVDPLNNPDFLDRVQTLVAESAMGAAVTRAWPRKRTSGTVHARLQTTTARILDVSYGGLKLAFGEESDVPAEFDVTVPESGITVRAQRIWTSPAPTANEFWCGAEVMALHGGASNEWREFVDSVV